MFEKLDLGFTHLKNRIMMGSMHTGLEDHARDYPKLAAYFAERARGGVGLIVTGGISPNRSGCLAPFASKLTSQKELSRHQLITQSVHEFDCKIVMQILHAGRYAYHPWSDAPSAIKSPITPFKPWAMSHRRVLKTISHFARCAFLAKQAGYDGVEVMGSEGYLITQFLSQKTNQRQDEWGGSYQNRMRFAVNVVKAIRERVGSDFIIIFRLSLLDLLPYGSSWDEILELANALEKVGVTLINTGIGWHEARIPTIATMVPQGVFTSVSQKLKQQIQTPVITSNRINNPQQIEAIISEGVADMVSMARPFLADPDFVNKAWHNQANQINTCIACNQACLDHIFVKKRASCLVNPRACHETELQLLPAKKSKHIVVVGAGPAGCAFAIASASRGHQVTLFDADSEIGGQFNLAKTIPGKADFYETLRYFKHQLAHYKVNLQLNTKATDEMLQALSPDEIIIATGITPRRITIPGIDHPSVLSYLDVLKFRKPVGENVVIIGAGGIGFDVATYLLEAPNQSRQQFCEQWGIDMSLTHRGGIHPHEIDHRSKHNITLCQRKAGKLGKNLGKTTGWIHRTVLKQHQVKMLDEVIYEKIDDAGLHITRQQESHVIAADNIIICAGQVSEKSLADSLQATDISVHCIGGAYQALELDAKSAIAQATKLASHL